MATACLYQIRNTLTRSPAHNTEAQGQQFFCMSSKIHKLFCINALSSSEHAETSDATTSSALWRVVGLWNILCFHSVNCIWRWKILCCESS